MPKYEIPKHVPADQTFLALNSHSQRFPSSTLPALPLLTTQTIVAPKEVSYKTKRIDNRDMKILRSVRVYDMYKTV